MSEQFGTVTRRPVHPASPVLLTKNGPLRIRSFARKEFRKATLLAVPIYSLRIGQSCFSSGTSNHSLDRIQLLRFYQNRILAILGETSEGTSY